jgi:imidazole glycerol-phosphate synthase subunit HisH
MIGIVDYGLGNLGSISNMLKRLGHPHFVTSDPENLTKADKIILPGVGSFDKGMNNLRDFSFAEVLDELVIKNGIPILGLCLGMQLFTMRSQEGEQPGLGWIDAETVLFDRKRFLEPRKVPHMGWNYVDFYNIDLSNSDMSFTNPRYYFVHSYHIVCNDKEDVLATTNYGYTFVSAIHRNNILGTQFHPEKSHKYGMAFLNYFASNF